MELRGTLKDFSLEAILGLIRSGRKTGTLDLMVTTPARVPRRVSLSFLGGEITLIQCGPLRGLDALREAAICAEGSFEFGVDSSLSPEDETVPVDMEVALATIDEARNAMKSMSTSVPTTGVTFNHAVPVEETIHISLEEFRLLAVMHDGMTLNDLIAANTAPTVDTMRIVRQLMERGLLVTGVAVATVDQMAYEGVVALAEYVGGQAGVTIFNQYFRPGAPVAEWTKAAPAFRS
ncbi:MAG TPA: DUF4388 domain-containing protein, partial [Clostridia bacterium]|nr:DUF4388 domain-containing protein [Clostridia bacterium]